MHSEIYKAQDGKDIYLTLWDNVENPVAVLQIVHGMSEHIGRYADFAEFMNKHGYIVVGDDHRCHGKTDENKLGIAAKDEDVFFSTVSDEIGITDYIKNKYNLPVVLFGHSYGSFISQAYLLKNSAEIKACILSGTAKQPSISVNFASMIANIKCGKKAEESGKFFANKTFAIYDKKIKDGVNGWLSRDKESNKKYNEDKLCGFLCSNGFYKSMFNGLKYLNGSDYKSVVSDLPMLIVYGTKDYVGGCGKYVKNLADKYKHAGLKNLTLKGYDGARHELLNETCREEVKEDILKFCNSATI